jgi:hypothetical protein
LIKSICKKLSPTPNRPKTEVKCTNIFADDKTILVDAKAICFLRLFKACKSRTLTKADRAYRTVKKEVLALLYTLKTMDFFLRFANYITILVDAKAICFLRLSKDSVGILLRFSLELSKYNCTMVHVPGENNKVSDVLSRPEGIDKLVKESKTTIPITENKRWTY